MYTPRIMMSSVCAAALLTASSAAAEVTATEVWANWKDSLAIYGEGSLIVENEVVGADSVVAEGVALSYSDGTGSMSADLGTITLQEVGDGTVEVSMAETFPIMISDPDGGSTKVTVTQEGLVLLVSGTPEEMSYDVTADSYAVVFDEVTGSDGRVDADVRISMNGLSGTYDVVTGDLRNIDYSALIETVDILFDVTDPGNGGNVLISGKLAGLSANAVVDLPLDMSETDPDAIFQSGFALDGGYAFESATFLFEIDNSDLTANGTMNAGSSAIGGAINANAIRYETDITDVSMNVQSSDMPFPVTLSASEYGVGFAMPMAKTEEPQDFAFSIKLADLAVNEEIWMMADPGNRLPHDPATLRLDLSGMAKLLFDITDPEQAAAMAMAAAPGELYSLDLNELVLNFAGAAVNGSGSFTFDNSDLVTFDGLPRPEGEVTVNIDGANALIDNLIAMGVLPEDQAMMGRMMMGMFARTVGDDQLSTTIEVNSEGHVLANGQRIQ